MELEDWEEGTYSDSIVVFNIEVVVIVVVESVVVAVVFVGHACGFECVVFVIVACSGKKIPG